ncbi:rhodanese-like domain-containing protein, partial [Burkholderia cepacia]|nr:rhodanese-like domain-containing protein [Burkholderia cepacia]
MSTLDQLYAKADERRAQGALNYAGALLPAEAFELLQLDPSARLVDVRTRAELDWIGRPLVGDGQYLHLEWTRYPGGVPNAEFVNELK